ncbi:MAG: FAD-dependent oxidoreductase [Halobacteriales archaeon]|nr:FAD-dependent oxidoreductase [Halobacteriales archaeon]
MTEQVSVVGGGIVGLTTAVFLELKGYDTTIYTKEVPYDDTGVSSLATNYAAASVKPVVVDEDDVGKLTRVSDSFYERLEPNTDAVSTQDNFEIHGYEAEEPGYADALREYRTLEEYRREDKSVVPEPEDGEVHGWVHEIFFVEMPRYVPALFNLYEREGGAVEKREVTKDEIDALSGDTVVNCTGYGNLFDDDAVVAKRGHLVEVETKGRLTDRDGKRFSYSYYPEKDEESDGKTDEFVYAYPRDDCLLLGGSEQEGDEVDGEWVGEEAERVVSTDGVDVPARIVELNAELIESKCGVDISPLPKRGRAGYRPYRRGGVRIEKETYDGKEVVHNYGHGGAGVTLSWYSANRVYNLLSGAEGFDYGTLEGVRLD